MSRSSRLALAFLAAAGLLFAQIQAEQGSDPAIWDEYGLVHKEVVQQGRTTITEYRMKDPTGAIAAWEWLRSASAQSCKLASFCTLDGNQVVIARGNYVLVLSGGMPSQTQVDSTIKSLPDFHEAALPGIFAFLPRTNLVPHSARYILGPVSLSAFAPELKSFDAGFHEEAEAQTALYKTGRGETVRLAIFDYPSPEMARLHFAALQKAAGPYVKHSGNLLAAVLQPATEEQASSVLNLIRYQANITWDEQPPPSPVKPLYQLLLGIIFLSLILTGICLVAGLMYAGMRIYRRRHGNLEEEEAMITLHLTGD